MSASSAILSTGQRHCYDVLGQKVPCAGTRQDAAVDAGLAWPHPRFAIQGERVRDRLTHLEWSRNANPAGWPMPLADAHRFVAGLNEERYLERDDWRVPTRGELRSLTSFADRKPALPRDHPFVDVELTWYWTATRTARLPSYAWYVHLEGARTFFGHRAEDHLVWPCRGTSPVLPAPAAPTVDQPPRFEVRKDAVLDHRTGLEWSRNADLADGLVTWPQALELVGQLDRATELPGRGWRLPTINELDSLVDLGEHDPALPAAHPFKRVRDAYWSSTSSAFEPDWCMALYFDAGRVGVGQKKGRWFSVWAVRDPA